jgi:hypothetical protein
MIRARIQQGRIEAEEPIPAEWEGQAVKIRALTPDDDPLPDLEKRLAALHAMGPMEFEPGEREIIAKALDEVDRAAKSAMNAMAGIRP